MSADNKLAPPDVYNTAHREGYQQAFEALAQGMIIAMMIGDYGSYGIVAEITHTATPDKMAAAKQRPAMQESAAAPETPRKGPLTSVITDLRQIATIIDTSRMDDSLIPIFQDPEKLSERISSKLLVRIPIVDDAQINGMDLEGQLTSTNSQGKKWFQFFHPGKASPKMQKFYERYYAQGNVLVAGTSANFTGEGTITHLKHLKTYASEVGIPMILLPDRRRKKATTSYVIGTFGKAGVELPGETVMQSNIEFPRSEGNRHENEIKSDWPERICST